MAVENYVPQTSFLAGPRGILVDTPNTVIRRVAIGPGGPTTIQAASGTNAGFVVHAILVESLTVAGSITLLDNGTTQIVLNLPIVANSQYFGPFDVLFATNIQETIVGVATAATYTIYFRAK
jgi:hypothetical protein